MIYAYILICILFAWLIIEAIRTEQSIRKIDLKIHVNGTRGKSSITKYILAALQGSGIRSLGKVTGELPTLIYFDGNHLPIKRFFPARVNEQFRIIRKASRLEAKALVLECMSIDPALQKLESRFFKPDIYIVSNIRDDHREKIAAGREERAESYCQAIPENCKLVTADIENIDYIKREAEKKNCRLIIPQELDEEILKTLPFGVFADNIQIALEVAELAGIGRDKALNSILTSLDKAEKYLKQSKAAKKTYNFLNAFSVNDTDSANEYLDYWLDRSGLSGNYAFIFNTRADRPTRTQLFTEWIKERQEQCKLVVITGDHKEWAYRQLKCLRPDTELMKIRSININTLPALIEGLDLALDLIIGIGNIGGDGYRILKEFKSAS